MSKNQALQSKELSTQLKQESIKAQIWVKLLKNSDEIKIPKSTVVLIMLKLNESCLFSECIVWTNIAGLNQIFFSRSNSPQVHIILEKWSDGLQSEQFSAPMGSPRAV